MSLSIHRSVRTGSFFWSMNLLAASLFISGLMTSAATAQKRSSGDNRDQQEQLIRELADSLTDQAQMAIRKRGGQLASSGAAATSELKAARPALRSFADRSAQFVGELNDASLKLPALRSFLSESTRVAAQARMVDRVANQFTDHHLLRDEIDTLDAHWRNMLFRLQRQPELQRETSVNRPVFQSMTALTTAASQFRSSLQMQPLGDRRPFSARSTTLLRDLEALTDDVRAELGRSADVQTLTAGLNRVRQRALSLDDAIDDPASDLDTLRGEYARFESIWLSEASRLQARENRMLDRSLRRVMQTTGELRELLQLPQNNQRQELVFLCGQLRKDLDAFFQRTPLLLLLQLPKSNQCLAVADEFYGVCENFLDIVNRDRPATEAVEAYHYIESAHDSFLTVFGAVKSQEALDVLQKIDQTIHTLGTVLHAGRERFSRSAALELASKAQGLSDEINRVVRLWLMREKPSFTSDCLNEMSTLDQQLSEFQRNLMTGASQSLLRREADQIYDTYRRVYGYLTRCQSAERPALGRLAIRLTPTLFDLRLEVTY